MQMHPEPGRSVVGSWLSAGFATLLLAACAVNEPRTAPSRERPTSALQQIAARMPGEYVSVQSGDDTTRTLLVEERDADRDGNLALSLIQTAEGDDQPRYYGLELEPTDIDSRLTGRFALLDSAGSVRRSCPMRFHVTRQGLVGETTPGDCRFSDGDSEIGLLKEFAFNGRGITIGDRLIDLQSNQPRSDDQIVEFLPARAFNGWLGILEGGEWRVARDFTLRTGDRDVPLDAADMDFGLALALNYYRMDNGDGQSLMRLTVTDRDSGEVIAEAWAEPGSGSLGIALPDLQVGLSAD